MPGVRAPADRLARQPVAGPLLRLAPPRRRHRRPPRHRADHFAHRPRRAAHLASLATLTDPSAIQEQLDRIQRAIIDDPALAIGSAKELVESTAKVVLIERGRTVNEKDDLPALARAAQEALGLHSSTTPGPDGSDAVKKILGAVSTIATSLGELRNRGYGTGHGPAPARVGLRARHAHLAVNAAVTWCQLLLDTLADPDAPWHKNP